jgi:hypothetical protein
MPAVTLVIVFNALVLWTLVTVSVEWARNRDLSLAGFGRTATRVMLNPVVAGVMFTEHPVTGADERADGEPLLRPVVRGGRLAEPLPALDAVRAHCARQLAALPEDLRGLDGGGTYPIGYSDALEAEATRLGVKA